MEAFVEKWVGVLAGAFARYAYGMDTKLNERAMVHLLERCVAQMWAEAQKAPVNGKPAERKV